MNPHPSPNDSSGHVSPRTAIVLLMTAAITALVLYLTWSTGAHPGDVGLSSLIAATISFAFFDQFIA